MRVPGQLPTMRWPTLQPGQFGLPGATVLFSAGRIIEPIYRWTELEAHRRGVIGRKWYYNSRVTET